MWVTTQIVNKNKEHGFPPPFQGQATVKFTHAHSAKHELHWRKYLDTSFTSFRATTVVSHSLCNGHKEVPFVQR
eukprot:5763599-Amphidinium_carterae.1